MAAENKSPEIRFKGFTDKWEEKKYSEIFAKIPNNTLSRAELNYNYGLAKNVHYGDVLIKYGELLDVEKDEIPYITDDLYVNKFKTSKLQNGDVIIADAAEDAMVGKCTELVNIGEETIFSGLHTIPSRPTFSFASGYLGYYMNSPAYHTQLLRLMQGTKVLSISKTVLQVTAIIYPNDISEQSQIGTYFNNLDNLITLRQRKLDKLGTIKKAMLEKMFPKNGALVPEIRFKGFTEDWEERKLGEIVTFINGRAYSQNELLNKGKYKVLRVGNFYTNDSWYYSDMELGEKYYANKGDLLYTWSASFGPHIWHGDKVIYHYHIWKLELSEHLDYFFSVHLLNNDKKKILNDKNGSTMVHITKAGMEQKFVLIPKIEEQNKITSFLDNLDQLTTLQQRELEKLKNIKKACLEKMFV